MVEVVLVLKILLYGVFGHYILRFIDHKTYVPGNFYSLYYALFSIASLAQSQFNVVYLFLLGIFWSNLLKLFLSSIDKNLVPNVNCLMFGLLNIMNFYVLGPVFDALVAKSSSSSVIILFVLGAFVYFIDLSSKFRKLT